MTRAQYFKEYYESLFPHSTRTVYSTLEYDYSRAIRGYKDSEIVLAITLFWLLGQYYKSDFTFAEFLHGRKGSTLHDHIGDCLRLPAIACKALAKGGTLPRGEEEHLTQSWLRACKERIVEYLETLDPKSREEVTSWWSQ
jgi:hypothetical protein